MRFTGCLAAIVCASLVGCASPRDVARELMKHGDVQGAERQLVIGARDGDGAAWNDLGVLYHRQGRIGEAVDAFTMGARYGDPTARANLARNGLPIPAADLAGRSSTDALGTGIGAFTDGYNRGGSNFPLPTDAPGSVVCDARQTSMGPPLMNKSFEVNCR